MTHIHCERKEVSRFHEASENVVPEPGVNHDIADVFSERDGELDDALTGPFFRLLFGRATLCFKKHCRSVEPSRNLVK